MRGSTARRRALVCLGAVAALALAGGGAYAASDGDRSDRVERAIEDGRAKNVILLIGDGMGQSEITVARNYEEGAGGHFDGIDALPLTGDKTTYSVTEDDPDVPDYDPESASTASATSTGEKTSDGRISTLPGTDDPDDDEGNPDTILELAKDEGLGTGLVTTSRITDATPAGPSAHVPSRDCEGPEDTEAEADCENYAKSDGGPGSIAEQQIRNPQVEDEEGVDVLLGGGFDTYEQETVDEDGAGEEDPDGETVTEEAQRRGYEFIRNEDELDDADGPKLLGLFDRGAPGASDPQDLIDPGNLQPEWNGEQATFAGDNGAPGQTCDEDNPSRDPREPDLDQMSGKALDILDRDEDRGFFLQVEGASIDKRAHTAQPCEQIGETVAFDRAVEQALDFAREDGDTLVIVTGDHGHATQIVEASDDSRPIGCSSVLETKEGAPMRVSYATVPEATGASCVIQEHTGTQIRIAAQGPQAANVVGLSDDTDTFATMVRALGLPGGDEGSSNRSGNGSSSNDDDDDGGGGNGGTDSGSDLAPQAVPAPIVPPGVGLLGLERSCGRSFVVRPFLTGGIARQLILTLDGRRVGRSGLGGAIAYRVPCRRLEPGEHRLGVSAVELAGTPVSRTFRFTRR